MDITKPRYDRTGEQLEAAIALVFRAPKEKNTSGVASEGLQYSPEDFGAIANKAMWLLTESAAIVLVLGPFLFICTYKVQYNEPQYN